MKKIFKGIQYLSQKSYNKFIIIAFVANIILMENESFGKMHIEKVISGFKMLDMNFYNSIAFMQTYLVALGEYGRSMYLLLLHFDLLLSVTFFLLQATLLTRLLSGIGQRERFQWIIVFPLIRSIADLFETVSFIIVTANYPESITIAYRVAQIATPVKWIILWTTLLILFLLLGLNIINVIKSKRYRRKGLIES